MTIGSDVLSSLQHLEEEMAATPPINPFSGMTRAQAVEPRAGVYIIRRKRGKQSPVYVGESCNLHARFGDLGRTQSHTFRRSIARELDMVGVSNAALSERLAKEFEVVFTYVDWGRKEMEEYLILTLGKRFTLRNTPLPRLESGAGVT